MDNGVIHAAAGGNKRKSNSFLAGAEDLKENVKGQRVWTSSRLDDIVGLKSNNAHNVVNAQRSAVDWMPRWTTTPHQKPPQMPSALSPVLNYGAMAAAALQDLRAIDPPNHFYQPQKPPQRQQQPQLQSSRQHLPAAESSGSAAGLLQEVSVSAILPQSPPPPPVRLPPLPLIRTPAAAPQLYNESDLHNSSISPTTSSCSSPYTSLQQHCNMIQALPHSHNTSTSSSLQEFSNEQTYSTLLQTSQNGTTQQQQQHQLQSQQQQQQQQQQQLQQLQQHQQQPSSWLPERNNTIQKELQQVSTTSWYPSIRTASASPESQSVASSSRLQRMDTPTVSTSLCAPQVDTQTLSGNSSIAELGNQVGFSNAIQCSNQRVYRDAFTEQDQQAQFDHRIQSAFGGGGLGLMGAPKRCPSPSPSPSTSSRLVKCSSQSEAQGRGVLLSSPYSSQPNAGAEFAMNPSSAVIKAGLDDNGALHHKIPSPARPVRTYTKVYKLGSITRALDVNRFKNYAELRCELAQMFNLEGQLEQKHGWQLVFADNENDLLLVGDDPWEEFKITVRGIRILSPLEVRFYTDEQFGTLNPSGLKHT